jgi:hypothetical protein
VRLLRVLQQNNRLTAAELSEAVNLSSSLPFRTKGFLNIVPDIGTLGRHYQNGDGLGDGRIVGKPSSTAGHLRPVDCRPGCKSKEEVERLREQLERRNQHIAELEKQVEEQQKKIAEEEQKIAEASTCIGHPPNRLRVRRAELEYVANAASSGRPESAGPKS